MDLDLSHLHLPVLAYLRVLEAIVENPKLQYINIAGNQIVDLQPTRFEHAEKLDVRPLMKFSARRLKKAKTKEVLKDESVSG